MQPEANTNNIDVLVFDYDGTLTLGPTTGIPQSTQRVLRKVSEMNGIILGIVSGRELTYLRQVNNSVSGIFSFLVAENGAVTEFGKSDELLVKGREWSQRARLAFSSADFHIRFYEIIGASRRANADKVTQSLNAAKLDAKLAFNRDSMMMLPPNVDKGIGVSEAVSTLGRTKEIRSTCFGDGENDVALFGPADTGVAVSDAVDQLKKVADVIASRPGGLGVEEYLLSNVLRNRL